MTQRMLRRKCPVHSVSNSSASGGSTSARSLASTSAGSDSEDVPNNSNRHHRNHHQRNNHHNHRSHHHSNHHGNQRSAGGNQGKVQLSPSPATPPLMDDIVEEKIYLTLKAGENLGCSVVRGPPSYPGIFVQDVKKDGVAESAGLEVGDQIVGMNGFSFYPGHYNFDDAISKIKACSQMTLTVRKRVGITFFPHFANNSSNHHNNRQRHLNHNNKQHQHKVRAVVHSPPSSDGPSQMCDVTSFHLPPPTSEHRRHHRSRGRGHSACHSPSSTSDCDSEYESYDPEKDFDLGLGDTTTSDRRMNSGNNAITSRPRCKVHGSRSRSQHRESTATLSPEEIAVLQQQLEEEKRRLVIDQRKLQEEMQRLAIERKQLESLRKEKVGSCFDDGTGSSSSDGISSCSSSFDSSSITGGGGGGNSTPTIMSPTTIVTTRNPSATSVVVAGVGNTNGGVTSENSIPYSCSSSPELTSNSSATTGTTANGSSIDSAISSTSSGTSSPSLGSGGGRSSGGTTTSSQMGFLDELKKLAENRSGNHDGLLMDTLRKTGTDPATADSSGSGGGNMKVLKQLQLHPDDEKRRQHEMLMEEFKSAHLRMFGGKQQQQGENTAPKKEGTQGQQLSKVLPNGNSPDKSVGIHRPAAANQSNVNSNHQGNVRQLTSGDSSSPETVKILRTSRKAGAAPPPPPPPPPPRDDSVTISSRPINVIKPAGGTGNGVVGGQVVVGQLVGKYGGNANVTKPFQACPQHPPAPPSLGQPLVTISSYKSKEPLRNDLPSNARKALPVKINLIKSSDPVA